MAERLWLCTQCEIIWQGHWNNALNKTGSAHRRAQFISGHLNILFKVLRSCNLVVPLQQAGGLGSLSEDGGAREQPHTTMANQPLQQPCFCQVQFNSPWSFYSLWCLLVPATVKCSSPKRRHSLACLFIYFHRLSVSGDRVWNKVRFFFAGLAWSSANQARSSFFFSFFPVTLYFLSLQTERKDFKEAQWDDDVGNIKCLSLMCSTSHWVLQHTQPRRSVTLRSDKNNWTDKPSSASPTF